MPLPKKGDMARYSPYFGESGETEHPFSLQDICLNYLCNNLNEICVTKTIVVTPKRRRVSSGSSQSYITDFDCGSEIQSSSYQTTGSLYKVRGPNSASNERHAEVVYPAVLVSPNYKPILPYVVEHFETDTTNSRQNLNKEGKK